MSSISFKWTTKLFQSSKNTTKQPFFSDSTFFAFTILQWPNNFCHKLSFISVNSYGNTLDQIQIAIFGIISISSSINLETISPSIPQGCMTMLKSIFFHTFSFWYKFFWICCHSSLAFHNSKSLMSGTTSSQFIGHNLYTIISYLLLYFYIHPGGQRIWYGFHHISQRLQISLLEREIHLHLLFRIHGTVHETVVQLATN